MAQFLLVGARAGFRKIEGFRNSEGCGALVCSIFGNSIFGSEVATSKVCSVGTSQQ